MKRLLAVLIGLFMAQGASADDEHYISVLGDYLAKPSSKHMPEIKNGVGGDIRYGTIVDDHWSYELRASYGTLKMKSGGPDGFHSLAGGNALFRFHDLWTVTPYLVGGGILAFSDLGSGKVANPRAAFMVDLGAGAWTLPFAHIFDRGLSARAEVTGNYEHYDKGFVDVRAYLGLQLALSPAVAPPPPPAEKTSVVEPVVPESSGAPVAEPAPSPPAPAAEAPCKTPGPGEKVSLKGCGTGDVMVLKGVTFDFNKASLQSNAKILLDSVAEQLAQYAAIKVEVGGHTDAKGSHTYNQKLSEKRAAAVVKYLAAKGIAEDRMTSVGYAETQPIADNDTDEGRERNRRVELKITEGAAAEGPAPASPPAESESAPVQQPSDSAKPTN